MVAMVAQQCECPSYNTELYAKRGWDGQFDVMCVSPQLQTSRKERPYAVTARHGFPCFYVFPAGSFRDPVFLALSLCWLHCIFVIFFFSFPFLSFGYLSDYLSVLLECSFWSCFLTWHFQCFCPTYVWNPLTFYYESINMFKKYHKVWNITLDVKCISKLQTEYNTGLPWARTPHHHFKYEIWGFSESCRIG